MRSAGIVKGYISKFGNSQAGAGELQFFSEIFLVENSLGDHLLQQQLYYFWIRELHWLLFMAKMGIILIYLKKNM